MIPPHMPVRHLFHVHMHYKGVSLKNGLFTVRLTVRVDPPPLTVRVL